MKFLEDAKLIQFDEPTHKYTFNGVELISATTFIDTFATKFDESGEILKRCALKEGVSEKELKKRWNDKGVKAASIGSKIHAGIEHYFNTGKIRKNKYTEIFKQFAQYKYKGKLFSEIRIWDADIGICGTADLLEVLDNKIVIRDFKTNEKKPTDYSFGKNMKYPISHLPDSKLTKYELQISLYLYILASKYNYEIGEGNCIYWINRKKNIIEEMPVTLRMDEITAMIAHYLYLKSLSPEELESLNKPKIIPAQSGEPEWVD